MLRDGSVEVEAGARELKVSRETIRRDLAALAGQGLVVRTRGGATATGTSLTERDLDLRSTEQRAEKEAIARYVADHLVEDGTSVALDNGTTMTAIARELRGRPITVVTASLPVINELAASDTTVVVVGGLLRGRSMATVGSVAEHLTRQFQCDLALMSGPAISAELGLMDTDLDAVAVKQGMLAHARRGYAVLDHTKLERTAFTVVCPLDELTGLVTDSGVTEAALRAYRTADLDVHVARTEEEP